LLLRKICQGDNFLRRGTVLYFMNMLLPVWYSGEAWDIMSSLTKGSFIIYSIRPPSDINACDVKVYTVLCWRHIQSMASIVFIRTSDAHKSSMSENGFSCKLWWNERFLFVDLYMSQVLNYFKRFTHYTVITGKCCPCIITCKPIVSVVMFWFDIINYLLREYSADMKICSPKKNHIPLGCCPWGNMIFLGWTNLPVSFTIMQ
jgi:hypothetical protein